VRIPILVVLAFLAAGCGGGNGGSDGAADDGVGTPTGADYEVFASEFAFAPPFIIVNKAGTYTISLRNDGTVPHNFTIKGVGKTPDVEPGETVTTELTVKKGNYEYFCSIAGHAEQGMDGTLNVLAP
jgi:uncharacterized cupredoxin-like copper-binding protein